MEMKISGFDFTSAPCLAKLIIVDPFGRAGQICHKRFPIKKEIWDIGAIRENLSDRTQN
jgi:hypothetical protein